MIFAPPHAKLGARHAWLICALLLLPVGGMARADGEEDVFTQTSFESAVSVSVWAPEGTAGMLPGTEPAGDRQCATEIPTHEGWLGLAVVLDLCSRSIPGWKLADSLHPGIVAGAMRRALDPGIVASDAHFHADRGGVHFFGGRPILISPAGPLRTPLAD